MPFESVPEEFIKDLDCYLIFLHHIYLFLDYVYNLVDVDILYGSADPTSLQVQFGEVVPVPRVLQTLQNTRQMSRNARKSIFGVSDHVQHKPVCAATEDGYKLEIS